MLVVGRSLVDVGDVKSLRITLGVREEKEVVKLIDSG